MKIAIAADKGGFALKEIIVEHLKTKGHEVTDVGQLVADTPKWWYEGCNEACDLLKAGKVENVILICGSGAGMAMLANKHEGVFAVACESTYTARLAKQFLCAYVLTMGGYVVGQGQAKMIVDTFIETQFAEGETPERVEYLQGQLVKLQELDRDCFVK